MQSHQSGNLKGNRLGAVPVIHTFPITYGTDTSATAKKLCTVPGSVHNPALYRVSAFIVTAADSGTSATLSAGITGAGYTDILNAVDLKAAAGVNYVASNPIKYAVADTDIYALPTWTGATTVGKAYVQVEVWDVNVNEPTAAGS